MTWHYAYFFFFSSRRRHTRLQGDWSSDVCSSDLFHSVRLRSGITARSISSSCSGFTGGVAWRFISPWVRNTGGSPTRRCRSEEFDWTSALSSSPSARSAVLYWPAAESTAKPAGGAARGGGPTGAGEIGRAHV